MAEVSEEIVRRVEALVDLLLGDDVLGRMEPRESGPVGTHEPCLGHNENLARWGYCPACEGEGLVRSRSGEIDPYLLAPYGNAAEAPPTPDPPSPIAVTAEPIRMTEVERHVAKSLRVRHALDAIRRLLARAPDGIRAGVEVRDRATIEWLAKRMRHVPRV